MKTVGIIAEYNPFHKGHAYQLSRAKACTGADYAVAVISGPFVQRGFPALADKYARAEMALRGGADLVLELPVFYAAGSAETFARGAVSLLESLGCVDFLCFGSECGDLKPLLSYARLFEEEPEGYRQLLRSYAKQGFSFPAARSRAAEEYLNYTSGILPCTRADADCRYESELLQSPNNILGIEYCRALIRRKSPIRPVTLRRISSGYHDTSLHAEFASASAIRSSILREGLTDRTAGQLPAASWKILKDCAREERLFSPEDFSPMLFYRLLSLSQERLAAFQDISEDLAARIDNLKFQFTGFTAFADLLKTKQLTHTHITRALCHILLDLYQEDFLRLKEADFPVYLRILGFRKSASPLLAAIKQQGCAPLLAKPADAGSVLSPVQRFLFEKDGFAAHICEAVRVCRCQGPFIHECTRSPILL